MNSSDTRSGYVDRVGRIVSAAELKGVRRLREALEGVGVVLPMDKVLDAFRRLPRDFKPSSVIDEIEIADDIEDDDLTQIQT